MKRLLLLALTFSLASCSTLPTPRPQPSTPAPSAPPYTAPATVAVVSLQAGTTTELPLTPTTGPLPPVTFGGPEPAPDPCIVVVKREADHQLASLQGNNCQKSLIWLDIKRGDVLLLSYGITTDNQVIATGDVEISREDGGLIVREIGAAFGAWST